MYLFLSFANFLSSFYDRFLFKRSSCLSCHRIDVCGNCFNFIYFLDKQNASSAAPPPPPLPRGPPPKAPPQQQQPRLLEEPENEYIEPQDVYDRMFDDGLLPVNAVHFGNWRRSEIVLLLLILQIRRTQFLPSLCIC